MPQLTDSDQKWWAPDSDVVKWLVRCLWDGAKVLEIGPGHVPFLLARTFVDQRELPNLPGHLHKIDIAKDRLPFDDKSFDFVYCRHVLEDMYNPFLICEEMSRVARAGYVETPSPLAEFTRGVDGGSPQWRGYHHHRFMIWENRGDLCFVSKFPVIECIQGDDEQEERAIGVLRASPPHWNTYYLWSNEIKVRHLQCPGDFDIVSEYPRVVLDAMKESMASTFDFYRPFVVAAAKEVAA